LKKKWVPMDGWVFQVQSDRGSIEGDELPVHKIPLLWCLYGSTQGVSGESELFYKNIKRLNQIENEYKGHMKAGEDAESFRKQDPLVDQKQRLFECQLPHQSQTPNPS